MRITVAILMIACVLSLNCGGTSPQSLTLNKKSEPKLRVFFQQPTTTITPTGDPEKDCAHWSQTATTYEARIKGGNATYADCDYDGRWDMISAQGEARSIYVIDTKAKLEAKVKNKLEMMTRTFAGLFDDTEDIIRGKENGTAHICVPNPNKPKLRVCGSDSYVLRGSEAARPYDQQYRLFEEAYKLQAETESPPLK